MASTLTLTNQSFVVGTQVLPINTIPPNSVGYELQLNRDASWDAPGHLFDFVLALSQDGGNTWFDWVLGNMDGGPAPVFHGVTATFAKWSGTWPGVDVAGVRNPMKGTDLRLTFNTARAFTSPLVTLKAV